VTEVARTRIASETRLPTRRTLDERLFGSGIEFDSPVAFVCWAERGLVVRQRDFSDWDDALREGGILASAARDG